ncbi:MAG TPA: hypothetical protein VIO14_02650 [Dehalococcoidia bacterium]
MRSGNTAARLRLQDVAATMQPAADGRGMVFSLDGRVYRALGPGQADLYRNLLHAGFREELFQAGLVRCWESGLELEGYGLVLECRRIPVVSYPPEWPAAVLREAGRTVAALGLALARHGLVLQDAHPWNVLFEGPRGVFVDLGSLAPGGQVPDGWMREFRARLVLPLSLHRLGLHGPAGALLARQGPASTWESAPACRWFPPRYARLALLRGRPAEYFARLLAYLGQPPADPGGAGDAAPSGGERAAAAFLDRLPRGIVVDLWAGDGARAARLARRGHNVVALERDGRWLDRLFGVARAEGLPLLPLRVDPFWPAGSTGLTLGYADAPSRLRGDLALAMDALHRLAGAQGLTFDLFARVLHQFARAAAVVEFVPPEDPAAAPWPLRSLPWYTLEGLVRAVEPYFPRASLLHGEPGGRCVLLFRREAGTRYETTDVPASAVGSWSL